MHRLAGLGWAGDAETRVERASRVRVEYFMLDDDSILWRMMFVESGEVVMSVNRSVQLNLVKAVKVRYRYEEVKERCYFED